MIINPIIPIWLMLIIVAFLIFITIGRKKIILQIAIIILLFIINLRIMLPTGDVKVITSNIDVLFVIDGTISMAAEDAYNNLTRLEAVKNDCEYIVEELAGARYSVITFSNSSQTLTPLTSDSLMNIEAIKAIQIPDELLARGSSLNLPKEEMERILKRSSENENRKRIVFFISDGEITNGENLESFENLRKYIDDGAVLGYGTEKGGKMKIIEKYTEKEAYMQDKEKYPFEIAISCIDEGNLKSIAKDMGIDYIKIDGQNNIENKLKSIKESFLENGAEKTIKSNVDIYYIFVLPLLFLLMYQFISLFNRK